MNLTEKETQLLEKLGLGGVLQFLTGTGEPAARTPGLVCLARSCKNNDQKGRCTLPPSSIVLDRNWECRQYERKK